MKRIRIGKDIEIHWPILTNGEQVTLEGRDLHLVLHLPSCMETPLHFEPQGNIAVFTISGNMQKQLGAYRLTMWENKDKSGQTAVDYCDAFELVPTTCMEGGNDNNMAGCLNDAFLEYNRTNGSTSTNVPLGSSTIIRESVFTEADNPVLVAAYPTYRDYLFGEHLAEYPSAYEAFLQDGKSNTAILAGKTRTDFYGKTVPCYPAAAAAAAYGMQVEGITTGLEVGVWWLPSAEELWLMAKGLIFAQSYDPVNRTLSVSGKVIAKKDYMASSTEYSSLHYFQVNQYGNTRWMLQQQGKYVSSIVRPVSEI